MIFPYWSGVFGNVRHLWRENTGFRCYRPAGLPCYTFLHFHNPVKLLVDGELVTTKPHACILYGPNTPQDLHVIEPMAHDWIHIDAISAEPWLQLGLELDTIYYPKSHSFITDLMQTVESESLKNEPGHEMMIELKLSELFVKLARSLETPLPTVNRKSAQTLYVLRREMMARPWEDWSAKRMASQMNISEIHCYTLYKRLFGSTPNADLIQARIRAAKDQLTQTARPIQEIAESLGYPSATQFTRQFTQVVGQSPRSYRKNDASANFPK